MWSKLHSSALLFKRFCRSGVSERMEKIRWVRKTSFTFDVLALTGKFQKKKCGGVCFGACSIAFWMRIQYKLPPFELPALSSWTQCEKKVVVQSPIFFSCWIPFVFLFLQILMQSMHKYQPRIHVLFWDGSLPFQITPREMLRLCVKKSFSFEETKFIAVTAYQNTQVWHCNFVRFFNPFSPLSAGPIFKNSLFHWCKFQIVFEIQLLAIDSLS